MFDTVTTSRKYRNLQADPRCAIVVWNDAITVQIEGVADEPTGEELERVRACYFAAYPDGRDRLRDWADLTYIRVRPRWARYSDFAGGEIAEVALS